MRSSTSLFGADLAKFVREGNTRGLFKNRTVLGLLTGEPEYLDPLKDEAPEGWIVTGYPWYGIDTPDHKAFLDAYRKKYDDYPRLGSIVGYAMVTALAAGLQEGRLHRHREADRRLRGARVSVAVRPGRVPRDRPPVDHGRLRRHGPRSRTARA